MPRYEFVEGTSIKFWEIALNGKSFTTKYGRIGTAGQATTKDFATAAAASAAYKALIRAKVKKGYKLADKAAKAANPGAAAAVFLADLRPSFLDVKAKDVTDALVKVGDAMPRDRLSAVLKLILDGNYDEMLWEALAVKPLPHIEPLIGKVLRGQEFNVDGFRYVLFAAAANAGLLHETAVVARAIERADGLPAVSKLVTKIAVPAAVLDVARPRLAAFAPYDLHDASFALTFGFIGLLAREGSKASLAAIEKFAKRAAKQDDFAIEGTVRMLKAAGKRPAVKALAARLEG